MKRVAIVTNFIPPYLIDFFEELEKLVGDLRIFVSVPMEANRAWDATWGELDVGVQRTLTLKRRSRHPRGFTEVSYVHFPYDTIWQLMRYSPDVVISNELGLRTIQAAMYSVIARRKLVVRVTISEETERGRGRSRRLIRRLVLRSADAVLVLGASGARYVQGLGAAAFKIHKLPHTIPISSFERVEPAEKETDQLRLVYVGQLIERKGILEFLECLADWASVHPEHAVRLRFAGNGPLEPVIRSVRSAKNLSIELTGPVPYPELPDVLAGCGILVFPTLVDSWGVVVNEAMAAGRPILGSIRSEAVRELVVDGETGWVFAPEDRAGVMDAIDRALSCAPEELVEMGSRARMAVASLTPHWGATRLTEIISTVR